MRRRTATLATATALAFAGLTAAAPGAHADATGCTGPLGGYGLSVCISVSGKGLQVDRVAAGYNASIPVCNSRLYITFFDTNNKSYEQWKSTVGSCQSSRVFEKRPNAKKKAGRVCGAVEISGRLLPGACVKIKK